MPESSDRWQSLESQPFPTLSVIGDRSELSGIGMRSHGQSMTRLAMTKGSDLLVAALEYEGVDRIFGIPGEENLDVVESLRSSSIELVLPRHEQAASFMAATYGRLTGRPGV